MDRVQLFENIVLMALADGSVSKDEFNLLSDRCRQWGIEDHQFREAIEKATSPGAEFHVPDDPKDRESLLREAVQMMGADGELSEGEKQLFAIAAATMNVSTDDLNRIIDSVTG